MNKKDINILIVDDEPLIRESLFEILRIEGYSVAMASSGEEAVESIKKKSFDVVLSDFKLPQMTGLELLSEVKKISKDIAVIIITGYGSIESAVEAMRIGAFDYITKPINDNEIKLILEKIVEVKQIKQENIQLKELLAKEGRGAYCDMIGASPKMQHVYNLIDSVASSNATILISGESGTGKGLVAQAIHKSDASRKNKPFVEVSCGALTETLLESELFGHVKGAFTGAIKDKEGRFEFAHDGTLFLDEIDAFSPKLQVKLLKVLQDGDYERVGDNVSKKANTRIIVATNQDLVELVEEGKFREDLYYRINVIAIQMPPLRERREDIVHIAGNFIKKYSKMNNKSVVSLSPEVVKLFQNYAWPGNVRELENSIEGAVIMTKTEVINKWDLPNISKFTDIKTKQSAEKSLKRIVEDPEKEHIITVLQECNWNRNKAAAVLGVNRTTLYNKMKKYDIRASKS